jgi:hypothetical protein
MAEGEDPTGGDEENGGGFLAFWGSLPGVLKGLAAVITAAIALIGVWRSLDGGGGDDTASPSTSGGSGTTASNAVGEPTTPGSDALAAGRLTLRDDDTANLKAKRVRVGDPNADLSLQGAGTPEFGILYAPYGGLLAETSGAVDKAGCVEALTARSGDRVQLADLRPGSKLCLKTAAGAIALLQIVSPPAIGSPELVFEYTLWA